MKPVIVAEQARRDLARLAELSERGQPVGGRVRELPVRFGRYGYVLRYRVSEAAVVITRAYHTRERR